MNNLELTKKVEQYLGIIGIFFGSKSGYKNTNSDNLVVFNSNLIIEYKNPDKKWWNFKTPEYLYKKVWHGDIDISKKSEELIHLRKDLGYDYYILFEMDARFENEDNPLIEKHLVKVTNNGILMNDKYKQYYKDLKNNPTI